MEFMVRLTNVVETIAVERHIIMDNSLTCMGIDMDENI